MADKDEGGRPSDEGITIVLPGGGGDGDGGGSSSSGGGSSEPKDPTAPYRSILLGMRLPPGLFADLMGRAAAERWTANDFLWALSASKQFNRMFPGIQKLLDQGMSVTQAVATWKGTSGAYEDALRDAGLWGFVKNKMSRKNIGEAIANGVDAEEMVFRVGIAQQAKRSEPLRIALNQILKQKGEAQLDKRGYLRFLLGKGDQKVNDIYEGAQLLQAFGGQEGLQIKQARQLAKSLGQPGQYVDVNDAIANVDRIRRTLGSQLLTDAGLDTADLVGVALAEEMHYKNPKKAREAAQAQQRIEQLLVNREAASKGGPENAVSSINGRPLSEAAPR